MVLRAIGGEMCITAVKWNAECLYHHKGTVQQPLEREKKKYVSFLQSLLEAERSKSPITF